ncbi:DUF6615 family protein, partial [Streptomyces albidoflavus]
MAIESLRALCTAMDTAAMETWRRIEFGRLPGRRFDEASVTDNLLFTLQNQVPGLLTYQSNQVQERDSGADWEWWIGDDQAGWVCLRIQAKKPSHLGDSVFCESWWGSLSGWCRTSCGSCS